MAALEFERWVATVRGSQMEENGRRLTVVDRHDLFAQVVARALEREGYRCGRVTVAGLTPRALALRVVGTRPELVLVGMGGGISDASPVVGELTEMGFPVVALCDDDSPARLGRAFAHGASAVASKDMSLGRFLALVREAVEGAPRIPSRERETLVSRYRESQVADGAEGRVARLTKQERYLLAYLMEGRTVDQIARSRYVSEGTVRSQAKRMMGKLGVHSQLAAVAVAWRAGYDPRSLHAER